MKIRQCFMGVFLLLFCAVLTGMSPVECRGKSSEAAPVQMEWKGNISNQKEPFIKIVETREAWNDLWLSAFEKPAPDIDFDRCVVACVFLGHQADWLYSIGFAEPVPRGDVWVISYGLAEIVLDLAKPFKASGQYAMKVFSRHKDAKMILEEFPESARRR
ncbi:MAG: hypothetical protein GYA67_00655 [Smithella sp.]|nr:hypothetical protein [Syntrophaceae bacterium]NMC90156.1 hypothetical protein [Smithella sp.]HOU56067.1 hypothetical protein [Smithellaceae bacterium]MBP8664960.1 hypothetical protein [Syntrophaceae bacterium]HQG98892.1 hypothetical protein [Smithellaceae bacterium]